MTTTAINYSNIECNVCKRSGGIAAGKLRRFSGPVVAIGYILLIPSVLGIIAGGFSLLVMCTYAVRTSGATDTVYQTAIARIDGLTPAQTNWLETVAARPTDEQLGTMGLNADQQQRVDSAWMVRSGGEAGAGIGLGFVGGFAIFLMVGSFVSGLLGWLLTMKRKVLLCGYCRGVHAESA